MFTYILMSWSYYIMTHTWYPLIRGNHLQFIRVFLLEESKSKWYKYKSITPTQHIPINIYIYIYIYIRTCFCEYRRVCLKSALMDEMHSLSCYWKTGMCLFVIYSLMVWLMIMSSKLFSCLSIIIRTINLFWRGVYLCIANAPLRFNYAKY